MFSSFSVGREHLAVYHLQFADNTIIFCDNSQRQIRLLRCVLSCFQAVSGLHLNLGKTTLFAIGEVPNLDQLAVDLECRQGKLSSTYLGFPLGALYKQKEVWNPMIGRMRNCLNGWKAHYLSKGGRFTLIKASLASILVHFLSLLVLPSSICQNLENIQRDSLWKKEEDSRGLHLVSWERVCTPKDKGGAGLHCLNHVNKALLCKWLWRFESEPNSLWRQVVAAKYGTMNGWDSNNPRGPHGCSL